MLALAGTNVTIPSIMNMAVRAHQYHFISPTPFKGFAWLQNKSFVMIIKDFIDKLTSDEQKS